MHKTVSKVKEIFYRLLKASKLVLMILKILFEINLPSQIDLIGYSNHRFETTLGGDCEAGLSHVLISDDFKESRNIYLFGYHSDEGYG